MSNKIIREHTSEQFSRKEIMHSSAYAQAQNAQGIGAASSGEMLDTARRQAIEEQRKYVRGYNNSKIMSSVYGLRKAATVPPRTAGGRGAVTTSNSAPNGSIGNVRSSYGRSAGSNPLTSTSRADAIRARNVSR